MSRSEPPVGVGGAPHRVRERFHHRRVLDDAQIRRLGEACSSVSTDPAELVQASRDWWPLALRWARTGVVPACPDAIAVPQTTAEVSTLLELCDRERIPVTVAGGRSGVCGGAIPLRGGVALDMRALAGITDVDSVSLLATAQAGTFGAELEAALRRDHGLTVGHWPQSIELSTLGGWVACRAAGQYSTRYGKIEDIVAGLEVVLASGELVRTGSLAGAGPRSATGPDLTQLFLGSEGTLGVVTQAVLRVHPVPPAERRAAWAFDAFADGLDVTRRTLRRGATPAVLRLYDAEEARRNFNHDGALLIAVDEGDATIIDAAMTVLAAECGSAPALGSEAADHWLATRNDVSVLGRVLEMGVVADTIEIAARWSELPALYRDAVAALRALEGTVAASAHESHAYVDGACLYFTFAGLGSDPGDDAWAEAYYRAAWGAVMSATRAHRGSISHHHGIGLLRAPYVADALGGGYGVLRRLKAALDPRGILNPGKLGLDEEAR